MRNLKRVLSLGMTAAMISGLMVSAGATGYTDVTAEDNVEAIEVLQAVGIMVGDEGGKFNPDQNVTRNEMAVIMANLMDYRVATYAGTSPFTDVPSWAEQYVAACYANGIVAGTSATTFGGNDTVTAGQAALMLMKALGYFKYQSDFGSDWLLATTQVATRINLFNGVEAGVREAMTRNDVAQLVLNTLKSTLVDAEANGVTIEGDGLSITTGNTKYYYRVATKGSTGADNAGGSGKYTAIVDGKIATGIDNASGETLELGEELYEGSLKLDDDATDTYGRPANEWKLGLDQIGLYPSTPLETYTGKVTKGELYSLLGNSIVSKLGNDTDLTVYANGKDVDLINPTVTDYIDRNNTGAAGNDYTNSVAGNGVQTEVFLNGDGDVTIIYINTYLMRATADYNADKGVLNVEVLTNPTVQNVTAGMPGSAQAVTETQLQDDEFDIKNYKEGDYIMYTVGGDGNDIASIAPAKVVTGKVNSYSKGNYVTIDGTKYEYSTKIEGAATSDGGSYNDSADTEYRVGDTASIVVDGNGYVLYVDSAAISLGNYVYIAATVNNSGLNTSYASKAYFTDGTVSEITVKEFRDNSSNDLGAYDNGTGGEDAGDDALKGPEINAAIGSAMVATAPGAKNLNGWYAYAVTSDGKYVLTLADTNNSASRKFNGGGRADFATGLVGDENSVLVVYDGTETKAYTGVKNFPEITDGAGNAATVPVTHIMAKDSSSEAYVSVAFVDATGSVVEDNNTEVLVFALKHEEAYVDTTDNEEVDVWTVIVNGEVKTIKVKDGLGQNVLTEGGMYKKMVVDKDGYYEDATSFATDSKTHATGSLAGDFLQVNGSSLVIGDGSVIDDSAYLITSDTKIVVTMMPNGTGSVKLKNDQMVDSSAKYEVKTVTGKQLDNMFGDYTNVYGDFYMVKAASDSYVVDTLYLKVTGVN